MRPDRLGDPAARRPVVGRRAASRGTRGPGRPARSESSGAPQPSTATASTGSPVSSANVVGDRDLQRVVGVAGRSRCPSRWRRRSRASRRACPSSSSRSAAARPPARMYVLAGLRRRAGSPAASAAPTRPGPAPARIRRTPSMWNGSPEWDAQASASSSPSRSSPARSMPTACIGLLHERGRIGDVDVADRPGDRAVRGQRHDRAAVVALDEAGADDLGDDHGADHARDPTTAASPARRDRDACTELVPTPVPQHCPTPRELDDLELLAHGALAPLTGFEPAGGLVTLHVPAAVAEAAQTAGELELVDPEGLPLARVAVESTYDAGRPGRHRGAGHPAHPRRVRRLPQALHVARAGPGRARPRDADGPGHRRADARRPGPDPREVRRRPGAAARPHRSRHTSPLPARPVRATLLAAEQLGAADVVAVPLASRGDAGGRPRARSARRRRLRAGPGARGHRRGRSRRRDRGDRRARPARGGRAGPRRCSSPACPAAASPRWPGRCTT